MRPEYCLLSLGGYLAAWHEPRFAQLSRTSLAQKHRRVLKGVQNVDQCCSRWKAWASSYRQLCHHKCVYTIRRTIG